MTPPRIAERFVDALLPDATMAAAILGDLAEDFATLVATDGLRRARRWYWRQVIRSTLPFLWLSLRAVRWRQAPRIAGAALTGLVATNLLIIVIGLALIFVLDPWTWRRLTDIVVSVLLTTAASVAGGYVAGRVSRGSPVAAALVLCIATVALGVWFLIWLPPSRFDVLGFILNGPATVSGGLIANSRRQRG